MDYTPSNFVVVGWMIDLPKSPEQMFGDMAAKRCSQRYLGTLRPARELVTRSGAALPGGKWLRSRYATLHFGFARLPQRDGDHRAL